MNAETLRADTEPAGSSALSACTPTCFGRCTTYMGNPDCEEFTKMPCSEVAGSSAPRLQPENANGDSTIAVETDHSLWGPHHAEADAAPWPSASTTHIISSPPRYATESTSDRVPTPTFSYHVDSGFRFSPASRRTFLPDVVDIPPAYTKE